MLNHKTINLKGLILCKTCALSHGLNKKSITKENVGNPLIYANL